MLMHFNVYYNNIVTDGPSKSLSHTNLSFSLVEIMLSWFCHCSNSHHCWYVSVAVLHYFLSTLSVGVIAWKSQS